MKYLKYYFPLILISLLPVQNSFAQEQTATIPVRTITVTGHGENTYIPDIVSFTAGVQTREKTAALAVTQNNKKMELLLQTLKEFDLPARNIQTSQYSIYPVIERNKPGRDGSLSATEIQAYVVDNALSIQLDNIEKLGSMLDNIVKSGASNISNMQFGAQEYDALLTQARRRAVQDARRKAQVLLDEENQVITGVQKIIEQNYNTAPRSAKMMRSMVVSEGDVPIRQGEQNVQVSVEITYSFKPQ